MKQILFIFLCLLLLATNCATQKSSPPTPLQAEGKCVVPVYYNGNDEPAGCGVFLYSEEQ
jgi:hypothetical protein